MNIAHVQSMVFKIQINFWAVWQNLIQGVVEWSVVCGLRNWWLELLYSTLRSRYDNMIYFQGCIIGSRNWFTCVMFLYFLLHYLLPFPYNLFLIIYFRNRIHKVVWFPTKATIFSRLYSNTSILQSISRSIGTSHPI